MSVPKKINLLAGVIALKKEKFGSTFLALQVLSLSLAMTALVIPNTSAVEKPDQQTTKQLKHKTLHDVGKNWYYVGARQYERGLFEAAEKSLVKAIEFQPFLEAEELEKINEVRSLIRIEQLKRKRILEHLEKASILTEQGQLIKAKAHLDRVQNNPALSQQQKSFVTAQLKNINTQLSDSKKEMAELYKKSLKYYQTGQFERARDGFVRVAQNGLLEYPPGQTPEEYLGKIKKILAKKGQDISLPTQESLSNDLEDLAATDMESTITDVMANSAIMADPVWGIESSVYEEPKQTEQINGILNVARPVVIDKKALTANQTGIRIAERKRKLLSSYTKAVVNNTVNEVHEYIFFAEFVKADEAINNASNVLSKNRLYLGDELFSNYATQLGQMREKLNQEKLKWIASSGGNNNKP
jgi:TolA-binding protein